MSLQYSDNFIYKIRKKGTDYDIKDAIAAAAIDVIQGDATTEGSIAKAKADAISTAASDATTKVNALKGTKKSGDTTAETIRGAKDYADNAISGLSTVYEPKNTASSLINNLDSTPTQTAADTNGNIEASVTQTNGKVTAISVNASTLKTNLTSAISTTESNAKTYADGLIAGLDATPSQDAKDANGNITASITQENGKVTAISVNASTLKSTLLGSSSSASSTNTIYGAKKYTDEKVSGLSSVYDAKGAASTAETNAKSYAKGLVDDILGEDSASSTLASLKQIIQELNDPSNTAGISGTFVDTVKSDLNGLTKTVDGQAVHATVKEYVDNKETSLIGTSSSASTTNTIYGAKKYADEKVSSLSSVYDAKGAASTAETNAKTYADGLITGLDSTLSQTQSNSNGNVAASITLTDGKVTTFSVNASTLKSTLLGSTNSASSTATIYGAKKYTDEKIAALDSTLSQTAADTNGNIGASITLTDGKVTALSVDASALKSIITQFIGSYSNLSEFFDDYVHIEDHVLCLEPQAQS